MAHWLAISNRENSKVVTEKNIWGVSKRHINTINRAKPGDTLTVYVGQEYIDKDTTLPPALTGTYTIESDVFENSEKIFKSPPKPGDEIFPYRIRLRPLRRYDPEINFKNLISHLEFIKNKKQWSGHIRGQAMRTIPDNDYELITKAAQTPRD